ncbi:MAG TPA: hypothetical protein VFS08_00065 [Gemmatimonadaceae bacterium]|nr:hypothetical protein [Gemmatimonadaceae bacterium]
MRFPLFACTTLALLATATRLSAQISLVGNSIDEHEAAPGERYEGTLVVQNTTAEPQLARLYQTDYRFFADGRSLYEAPGSTARSNAAWVALPAAPVTIPAGETATIHYRVTVPVAPADSLHGSYWSLIMVEGAAPAVARADSRVALAPTVRYAVQVVTHIGRTGAPSVEFTRPTATSAADGARFLEVDLGNAGDRAGRMQLTLELYGEDGRSAGTYRATRGLVYPGASVRQRFALGELPAGTYRALLVADAGAEAVFGAQYTLHY